LKFVQDVFFDGQRIYVADYGHNRVLIWNQLPSASGVAPDVVVGQDRFDTESGGNTATKLGTPASLFVAYGALFVATNRRVLVFSPIPIANGAEAIAVLGQNDLDANVVPTLPSATNIGLPVGLLVVNDILLVADFNFRRVLLYRLHLN
jgi:hypothetical protein